MMHACVDFNNIFKFVAALDIKRHMLRIDYNSSNLILRDRPTNWGGGVWLYNGQPFTGIKVYKDEMGQLEAESEFKDGILSGRQVEYWPNGNKKEEYF